MDTEAELRKEIDNLKKEMNTLSKTIENSRVHLQQIEETQRDAFGHVLIVCGLAAAIAAAAAFLLR
jgi:hypothetical protein